MDDLITWLRAQIDDDERIARKAAEYTDGWRLDEDGETVLFWDPMPDGPSGQTMAQGQSPHVARHDPARVLREVEANRRVLDGPLTGSGPDQYTEWEWTLKVLALPFSDRPGYRSEWKP